MLPILRSALPQMVQPGIAVAMASPMRRFAHLAATPAAEDDPMVATGKKHICRGIGRLADVCVDKAQGSWVHTVEGQKFLDFTAGIGVVNTGHCHPAVVKAAQDQIANVIHAQVNIFFHEPMMKLIPELLAVMPDKSLDTLFFWNSGAEAVEAAIKLARHATGKPNIIVAHGGYHGRTFGTMALTTSKTIYRGGFGPLMPGVFVTPFPYARQLPKGAHGDMTGYCLEQLHMLFQQQTTPEETAAIIMEPVLGEGGYVAPPKGFLQEVKKMANERGVLFIADEVQSGFGRTGKMFAVEHFDVTPDILIMAKGLASGFPLSAIASRKELMDRQPPGSMGGTYAGNAVACAAAGATLKVFHEEKLLENTRARGAELMAGLNALKAKYPIKEVRGLGLMVGVEFDESVKSGTTKYISNACKDRGMFLLSTSIFEVMRFIPPLTVSKEEIQTGLQIFEAALADVFGKN